MSIATLGERLVHYEALGHGEPVLFLHGWLGSWRYWWPSMQAISVHRRAFALDFWGFGDSTKDQDRYDLAAYVAQVDQFVSRLGIVRPLTIVGHALGAAVAIRFALQYPDRALRVALVAAPIEGQLINPVLLESGPSEFLQQTFDKNGIFPEVNRELRKSDVRAVQALARELSALDFAADLQACPCSLLLVTCSKDPVVGALPELWAGRQTGRHHVVLDKCGHFPMLEEPAKFNRLLLDFVHAGEEATISPKTYWQRRSR